MFCIFGVTKPILIVEAPYTIVLIDDDLDDIELFKEALHEVSSSTQFLFFQEFVSTYKFLTNEKSPVPGLIFIDLNLRIASGMDYIKSIKKITRVSASRILLYTTTLTSEAEEEAMALNVYRCIQKPNSYSKLLYLIREIMDELSNEL